MSEEDSTSGRAKGGKARAANLSPEQRRESAKRAAAQGGENHGA